MINIRKAQNQDSEAIIKFQKNMAWETEQLELNNELITAGVNAVFENPARGNYYVAEDNGKVIASLLITSEWSDWRNSEVWWFQSVYVLPEFRRKGIFRAMYQYIKNEAGKNNIAGLRLYVETNNSGAQMTYEALGMTGEHYRMYEWLKNG